MLCLLFLNFSIIVVIRIKYLSLWYIWSLLSKVDDMSSMIVFIICFLLFKGSIVHWWIDKDFFFWLYLMFFIYMFCLLHWNINVRTSMSWNWNINVRTSMSLLLTLVSEYCFYFLLLNQPFLYTMIEKSDIRTLFCYLLNHNIFVLQKLGIRICFRKKHITPFF